MSTESATDRMSAELQELVALEVKDILATATGEGYATGDVVAALELALRAEIEALAGHGQDEPDTVPDET